MSVKLQRSESCDGGYVPYSEYAALKAERDELLEALNRDNDSGMRKNKEWGAHPSMP
jgi:hypothetical protein